MTSVLGGDGSASAQGGTSSSRQVSVPDGYGSNVIATFQAAKPQLQLAFPYSNRKSGINIPPSEYQQLTINNQARGREFTAYNIYNSKTPGGESIYKTPGDLFGKVAENCYGRRQRFSTSSRTQPGMHGWDRKETNHSFFHYTFFPAVSQSNRYDAISGQREVGISALLYAVFYSSDRPPDSLLPQYGVWVDVKTAPPFATTCHVHNGCVGDDAFDISFQASLENFAPQEGSWIWICPLDERARGSKEFRVSGPSAGMAVAACLLGMPSILYTGFIRSVLPDKKILPRPIGNQYIGEMARAVNFVENVSLVEAKVLFAMTIGMPICFPTSSQMDKTIETQVTNFVNANYLTHVAKSIYTATQLEDGVPFQDFKTYMYMASTVADAVAVASVALAAWYIDPATPEGISSEYKVGFQGSQFQFVDTEAAAKSYTEASKIKQLQAREKSKAKRAANKGKTKAQLASAKRQKMIEKQAESVTKYKERQQRVLQNLGARKPPATKQLILDEAEIAGTGLVPLRTTDSGRAFARALANLRSKQERRLRADPRLQIDRDAEEAALRERRADIIRPNPGRRIYTGPSSSAADAATASVNSPIFTSGQQTQQQQQSTTSSSGRRIATAGEYARARSRVMDADPDLQGSQLNDAIATELADQGLSLN